MILTQQYSLLTRLASVSTIMYHGTSRKLLPTILSQGLIPNPKQRAWHDDSESSFRQPSRASLPGIYLTTNLDTATSSGPREENQGKCLVVVQVQSGSLLADEDDVKGPLNRNLPSREYALATLYMRDQILQQHLEPLDGSTREEYAASVDKAKEDFISSCVLSMTNRLKKGLTPQEEKALHEALDWGFHVALARRAAYLDYEMQSYNIRKSGVTQPDKAKAEQEFKRLEDRLTRILKRLGRPEHMEVRFSDNARIETPIGYSGKNKILAVVEVFPYVSGPTGGVSVIVRYPRSGEVPQKLITDWTASEGSWEYAVAKGNFFHK